VRAAWPAHLPMSVRISAHDWVEGGITPADAVEIARAFKAAGADLIDCSSGQVSRRQKPTYGRMYQTPFADRIRQEAGIATIAVGAISEADHVNSIIAAGRADLCAVARPHLANPAWTLTEAARIGFAAFDSARAAQGPVWGLVNNAGQAQSSAAAAHLCGAVAAHAGGQPDRPLPVQPRGVGRSEAAPARAASSTSPAPPASVATPMWRPTARPSMAWWG
jgi:anthraniloyl-CoA monooxygenase